MTDSTLERHKNQHTSSGLRRAGKLTGKRETKVAEQLNSKFQIHSIGYRWMRPSMLAFLALAAFILCMIAFGDRSQLLDQDNYVAYFRDADPLWIVHLWANSHSTVLFIVKTITDELGWRLWVLGIDSLGFSPDTAVRLTVVVLNVLMALALSRTRRPLLGLLLWALIPTGLATVGLFQIRQGFALSIAMYFAMCRQQPIRGALLASIVHTTFAYPALFLILAHVLMRRSKAVAIVGVIGAALAMSLASAWLFNTFGGRRLEEYSQQEAFTVNFLISLVLYLIVPALVLLLRRKNIEDTVREMVVHKIAIMHIGLLMFLIISFFVYPFGTQRIVYYGPLLLAFLLPEIRLKNSLVLWTVAFVLGILTYDVIKNYLLGTYRYFL
ncbi:EpsG family protein [Paraburkholderia sediminicola]|uniref:EpsG family protein n=1 Tax=Paraburkholderia sediminicola TaxID=458836 RepID=UPI0038BC6167